MGLRFKTFGAPELSTPGRAAVRLRYRKTYALLGYLLVERGRWRARKELAALFWPHLESAAARANLRLVLKDVTDHCGGDSGLRIERERIGLFVAGTLDSDLLLLDAASHARLRQCGDRAALESLLAGWQPWLERLEGEFLASCDGDGEFGEWLQVERAALDRARGDFLRECVRAARRHAAPEAALALARVWERCRPADDEAARALMKLLAASHGSAAALAAHADFARRLACLVGGAPAPETEDLRQRIAAADAAAARILEEVRHVVVLHVEPEIDDAAALLEPERFLAPLAAAFDAALARWGGRRLPAGGMAFDAVFGLADDGGQAPRRAACAAREIVGLPAFRRARAGLVAGQALVSAASHPIAGSVLPTLAQRMALVGDPGDVMAGETLAAAIGSAAGYAALAPRCFAGFGAEHVPCRLLDVRAAEAQPWLAEFPAPLVGREAALARLDALAAEAGTSGRAVFAEVVGAPGAGKSRLLTEFARHHREAGGEVRWIMHRPELRLAALGALRESLQARDTGGLAGRALIELLIARLFAAPGTPRPLLVVCDDLHWADEAMHEFLRVAMQAPPAGAALVMLAARPGAETAFAPAALPRLALEPLTPEESAALIAVHDPAGRIDAAGRARLARSGGGLPLFVEYLARAAHDRPAPEATLHGVLQSLLDRLGADRRVLQAAATVGATFSGACLGELLPGHDIAHALERAVDLAIVERRGADEFVFRHVLLRDCAYEGAPRQMRRDWHRAAAAWLARRPDAVFADIAHHYEEAHAWGEAHAAWRRAAETAYLEEFAADARAAAVRALDAAAKHGQCAPEELAELELLAGFATLMTHGYGARGAQKSFAPLVASPPGTLADETLFRALAGMVAAYPQGRREGQEMMGRLERLAHLPVHHMMVNYGLGSFLFWRGEFAASLARIDAAIRLGATIPTREWLRYSADSPPIACLALKATNLAFSGPAAEASATADAAVAAARRAGRLHGLCFALTLAASVHLTLDRPDDTARFAAEGLEIATRRDFQFWRAYNSLFGLWADARRGRLDVRRSFSLLALHREIAAASRLSPVTSWWFVACICEALEKWTWLDSIAARALTLAENGGDTYCMPDLMRQRALARLMRGDPAQVRIWLDRAAALMERQGSRGLAPRLARVESRLG